ncbi:LysR family transcriptional regulator [Desmospora activa]|uniref:DNA-binding transcriptional LysR family regulator n=1 Tax=Desmospora activa DSM 45169 TaxID=1121389 RepID=A0A2T4Z7E4_9BACL|nr:LysR family transcriptional regulator [Desmospora activa]PTM57799.1 DNA-binding transcriptional LysR family regulator [Desmospora activa DSM 45169]
MTMIQMEIFVKIVETKSFTKAGEELGMTQSAVSHAISSLESALGFQLIIRNRSGAVITTNGEKMLAHMRNILRHTELMKQDAESIMGLQKGKVRVGTFESVMINWMPDILGQFQHQFPDIKVELIEGDYQAIIQWLLEGRLDLGFILEMERMNVDFHPLKDDHLSLLIPWDHPLSQEREPSIEQVAAYPFIMPKKGCDEHVRRMFQAQDLDPDVRFVIKDVHSIIAMVKSRIGISIMPELTLPKHMDKVKTTRICEEVYRTIGIAAPAFGRLSPAAKKFFELTKSWVGNKSTFDERSL